MMIGESTWGKRGGFGNNSKKLFNRGGILSRSPIYEVETVINAVLLRGDRHWPRHFLLDFVQGE
jgi:hypothetical protein